MMRDRWTRWGQWLLVLTLPILLVALNLRVVTGNWFVRWEYQRAGFPADPFGLSTEERIRLAQVCQDFLASNADISLLADLKLPDGELAFNERELRHMTDVQNVYHGLTIAGAAAAVVWIGIAAGLIVAERAKGRLWAAVHQGGLFTLGLVSAVVAFMLFSWGQFFTGFHRIFFEGDTWVFPPSNTLIRLFPTRFWIDIAVTIVGLMIVEAGLVAFAGWAGKRRSLAGTSN